MNDKSNQYPLDVFSVKEFGVDQWLKNNMIWPILDEESISIGNRIVLEYISLIKKVDDVRLKALLDAQNKIVMELSGIFHSLLVLKRLSDSRLIPLYRPNTIFFPSIIQNKHKINGVYDRYKDKLIPSNNNNLKKSIKASLLEIYKNLLVGGKPESTVYSLSAKYNFYLKTYANNNNKNVKFYSLNSYKRSSSLIGSNSIDIKSIKEQIIDIIVELGSSYNLKIQDNIIWHLDNLIDEMFQKTSLLIDFHYQKLRRKPTSEFFIPNLGNINYRAFGVAAKLAGHKVIGSSHGNSIGMFDLPLRAFIDLSIVDKFLVVTDYAAKNYSNLQKKYLAGISDTQVFSVNSDVYKVLLKKHNSLTKIEKLKNIMIIEYPLTETRHNIYSFWPYQLKLMLKIGAFMRAIGLKTIMKRHPDRVEESRSIYEEVYDQQLTTPFEDVFEQADAFLFMNITSTTFGFAMTTNRPIFIFSTWLEEVWEEMIPLIKERCIVIPSWIDEKGDFYYDEVYFTKMLKSDDIWKINYDAVEAFMIP